MGSTDDLGTPGRVGLGTSKVPSGTHLESVMNILIPCALLFTGAGDRGGDRPRGVGMYECTSVHYSSVLQPWLHTPAQHVILQPPSTLCGGKSALTASPGYDVLMYVLHTRTDTPARRNIAHVPFSLPLPDSLEHDVRTSGPAASVTHPHVIHLYILPHPSFLTAFTIPLEYQTRS